MLSPYCEEVERETLEPPARKADRIALPDKRIHPLIPWLQSRLDENGSTKLRPISTLYERVFPARSRSK
ncbi:MAG: hypothetical protein M2R45_00478 [Verrucomicrobia subdivision 3 bacterium]|nr:hypothetical protein [Limisphaerales bacterium]